MKLWQRKKAWIKHTTKYLCNTYLWNAFFQTTTRRMCYIAWNTKHQVALVNIDYNYYNGVIHWFDGTENKVCENVNYGYANY